MALSRFRTVPVKFWQPGRTRVDRTNLRLLDMVAMQANVEALGHDAESDDKTLQLAAALGNDRHHVRSRLGHPGMSENATAKQVGMASNFRIEGQQLITDMQLLDTASLSPVFSQDPVEYLLSTADLHPTELALSAVMMCDQVWKLDDGSEWSIYEPMPATVEKDKNGRPLKATHRLPILRPKTFQALDVVGEGALTHNGMFEGDDFKQVAHALFAGTSSETADEVFEYLDLVRDQLHIPLTDIKRKANWVLNRYAYARGLTNSEDQMKRNGKVNILADGSVNGDDGIMDMAQLAEEAEALTSDAAILEALESAEDISAEQDAVEAAESATVAELRAQVAELSAQVATLLPLAEKTAALERLSLLNTKNIERMFRNLQRVNDDPVVTLQVPRTPPTRLEAPVAELEAYGAPVPPASAVNGHPSHVSQRRGTPLSGANFDQDGSLSSLAAANRRQHRTG